MRILRNLLPVLLLAVMAAVFVRLPVAAGLDALSVDVLSLLNRYVKPASSLPAASSPAAVVAIDEATYHTPPFADTPKVFWTARIARIVDGLCDAGAAVVAFDVVFPTSVEPYLPGYERPLLISLRQASRGGRLLLGKVQHSVHPVAPTPAQSFAVGHGANIRSLNLLLDGDGVVRSHPLFFSAARDDGEVGKVTSMAMELAARVRGVDVRYLADGRMALGDKVVAGSDGGRILLNFSEVHSIPVYSLADVFADIENGRREVLADHFAGKVVFIGSVLDVEDRWFTSTRLASVTIGSALAGDGGFRCENMPGVFIHATAVNNLLHGSALRPISPAWGSLVAGLLAALVVAVAIFLPVAWAATVLFAGAVLLAGISLFLFGQGVVLPMLTIAVAGGVFFVVALCYRFVLFDRQKWRIRRLFSLYTSPAMLDRLLKSGRLPELGGEERQVTVWFSDLAGFTALSEGMTPTEVVAMMNRYLTAITEVIEEYGGFVDKYIGDAVVAVFGAPQDDPEHPVNAVRAALAVREKLTQLHDEGCFGHHRPMTRVGLCSGVAMVGNIGSRQRFNYTVMGDTVNLASRLEGANKALGTDILLAESTVALLPPTVVVREVDRIRAKGRQGSVRVFEPIALDREDVDDERRVVLACYGEALVLVRKGETERAAGMLVDLAGVDPVAAALMHRLAEQALSGECYSQGVLVLHQK